MPERPRLAHADGHSAGDAADPMRLRTEGLMRSRSHQAAKSLYVALVFPRGSTCLSHRYRRDHGHGLLTRLLSPSLSSIGRRGSKGEADGSSWKAQEG